MAELGPDPQVKGQVAGMRLHEGGRRSGGSHWRPLAQLEDALESAQVPDGLAHALVLTPEDACTQAMGSLF